MEKEGEWGVLDRNGVVKVPFKYDEIPYDYSEGLVFVRKKNKTFVLNKIGEKVIKKKSFDFESTCQDCYQFIEGKANVIVDGNKLEIDTAGNLTKIF